MATFRPQRGSLKEALEEAVEVSSKEQLVKHLNSQIPEIGADVSNTEVKFYCQDKRAWGATYVVTVNKLAVGFTNAPL